MTSEDLAEHFPGEDAWRNFVVALASAWSECDFQARLLKELDGQRDIAIVAYALLGEDSLEWVDRQIPALGDCSPRNCLESERGLLRLKSALMRMPV